ncbi:MAG: hypothetical protein AseanaTS_00270 [Candidatus Pelagadaptatus aseana]|uniref:GAF domain-containing protein n=1 Tax=Candidatus Pelagadaptatus aseana TaxID=3120508 RepID=UPI0039B35A97
MQKSELTSFYSDILQQGLARFDLALGIVSRIENTNYQVVMVLPDNGAFTAGDIFPLQDTYCREVATNKTTVALTQLNGVPGLCKHPLYSGLPLESYISTPILLDGNVWGTLNFSSMKIRDHDFSQDDIEQIKHWAGLLAEKIKSQK